MIPTKWQRVTVGSVADVNPRLPRTPLPDEEVSFLSMSDLAAGTIVQRPSRLANEVLNGFTQFVDGDILIAKITPCFENGKGCICNGLRNGLGFGSTEFIVLRPHEGIDREFLYYQTVVESFRRSGAAGMVGSAGQKRLQPGFVRTYPIVLPPLAEQTAIASVLATWDRGIRQLTDLISVKLRFKQGLMEHILIRANRFRNFKDEWHSVRLSDVTEECNERNRGRMGLESVMAVTKADGIVPMRERTVGASIDRYLVVQKNCFAYNPMRINIGSIARWQGDNDILVSPDYVVFRCKEESKDFPGLDSDFLDHFRRSKLWEKFVMATGNGSVRIRIYYSELSRLKLKLPSLAEQKKIAKLLNAMDREIDLLRKQLDLLKLQKKGLMQKLLTGQVRVKLPKGAK